MRKENKKDQKTRQHLDNIRITHDQWYGTLSNLVKALEKNGYSVKSIRYKGTEVILKTTGGRDVHWWRNTRVIHYHDKIKTPKKKQPPMFTGTSRLFDILDSL